MGVKYNMDENSGKYNVWNMYGLKGNPFTTDPLSVYGDDLPIKESFFGREKEVEKIKKIIYSNKTSRILVYGDIGIGKTTFVNYAKYEAIQSKYFTPLGELGVQYNWTPEDFMFNTVSAVYTAIDRTKTIKDKMPKELMQKLNVLFGTERGYSFGGGFEALGTGITAEKSKSFGVPKLNALTIKMLFQEIIDELIKQGFKGIIIHYNNLELIQEKGENQLKRIMNGIRDFLQINGAHFIFVSDKTLYELFQQMPRVEDIFQTPILLNSFNFSEIKQIIAKRIQLLRINPQVNPIIPFEDETLAILFRLYSGNLRGILRGLECAVNETSSARPVRISPNILKSALFKFAQNRFLSKFSREDSNTIKILKRILEKKETTNKAIADHFKILPQNVSTSLTKLRDVGAVKLSREEGRSRYYVPSQEALWLLLEPTQEYEGQTKI